MTSAQLKQRVMPLPEDSVLIICDMQQRFREYFRNIEVLISNIKFMVNVCQVLSIPIIITEHVPKVFGPTVVDLTESNANAIIVQKTSFSVCCKNVLQTIQDLNATNVRENKKPISNVIITGIEGHICVFQSCMDLLSNDLNLNVHYLTDCIGSFRESDEHIATQRLNACGVCLSTSESIVFQLLRDARHPKFKQLQTFIKQHIVDIQTFHHENPNNAHSKL